MVRFEETPKNFLGGPYSRGQLCHKVVDHNEIHVAQAPLLCHVRGLGQVSFRTTFVAAEIVTGNLSCALDYAREPSNPSPLPRIPQIFS